METNGPPWTETEFRYLLLTLVICQTESAAFSIPVTSQRPSPAKPTPDASIYCCSSRSQLLQVKNVSYRPPGIEVNLLDHVSFELPERSLGLIFGRSGSGKTTLLQVLAGLAVPTEGFITVEKHMEDEASTSKNTGTVFQFPERKSDPTFSAAPMASGEEQSNPSTSGDAGRDHHEDFGNEYGPPLPTQEELREMEHRRLVGEATNLMLNFAKDPKLAKYMSKTAFQDVQAQLRATTTSPPKPESKKQYSEKELEEEIDARLARILGAQKQGKKHDRKRKKSTDFNGYLDSKLMTSYLAGVTDCAPQGIKVNLDPKDAEILILYFLADTVIEELTFGLPNRSQNPFVQQQLYLQLHQVALAVGLVGISWDANPRSLSDGYKRRLALAAQLVRRPRLLLLDEPLAGLDWKARMDVAKLLANLKQELTLIVVSHDLKELKPYVDKAWRMDPGGHLSEACVPS
ncbi:hypothetical protein L7F22_021177 [Adiantum nelumboides]|nr:hypothetical protein [Adiantum nelumboides]